jgi:hypothetical protein
MSEIDFWNDVLRRRDKKSTITAWSREIERAENPPPRSGGQPAMEEDRISHYRVERDKIRATTPHKQSNKRK